MYVHIIPIASAASKVTTEVRHTCCAKKKYNNTYTYYYVLLEMHKSTPSSSDGVGETGLAIVYIIGLEEYGVRGNNPGDRLQGNRLCVQVPPRNEVGKYSWYTIGIIDITCVIII